MKRSILLPLLFLLLRIPASAAEPMFGTYTVGGDAPDFRTPAAAIARLRQVGVNGPVTFEIRPGVYNEIVAIGDIPGATRENRVTLRGIAAEGELPTISAAAAADTLDGTLLLQDASHITIRDLHLTHEPGLVKSVVSIARSTDVEIIGCSIEGLAISNTAFINTISRPATLLNVIDAADLRITRNAIGGGIEGIAVDWEQFPNLSHEVRIDSNTIEHVSLHGILLRNVAGTSVRGNTILMDSIRSEGSPLEMTGCTGRTTIEGNRIALRASECSGIHLRDNPQASLIRLANNMVVVELGKQLRNRQYAGIYVDQSTPVEIYHNSVQVRAEGQLIPKPAALAINGAGNIYLAIANNIFACNAGPAILLVGSPGAWKRGQPGVTCDYNDLFGADSATGLIYTSRELGLQPTWPLEKWRHETGWDLHSLSVDPGFNDRFDLHITNRALKGAGTTVPNVPLDIDGRRRDAPHPDIGADEMPK